MLTAVNLIVVVLLCATTALASHLGVACFHDGIRPVMPEYLEGRLSRPQMASIAFGMSVGFIASVGISLTMTTNLLNPWLLFLTTDILGVISPKKWVAPILGGAWGALCLTALTGINTALTFLPVDLIGAMGVLQTYVVTGFSLFPIVAVFMQFGKKQGFISAVVVILARIGGPKLVALLTDKVAFSEDAWTMFIGVILLVGFAIAKDNKTKHERSKEEAEQLTNVFSERVLRIKKNLPLLMIGAALIAIAANIRIFAGSYASVYQLAEAYAGSPNAASLIREAALNEFMRGLGFIPLIATTAITTGVYGVAGYTFVYCIGYIMPNPLLAAVVGAAVMFVEVILLTFIGKFLGKYPSMRDASDNIRSSMGICVELALLIGSMNACITMGGATGFFIGATIYFINEYTGKKIMKMAIGPVAAIGTGLILNLLTVVGLFAPLA